MRDLRITKWMKLVKDVTLLVKIAHFISFSRRSVCGLIQVKSQMSELNTNIPFNKENEEWYDLLLNSGCIKVFKRM